MRRTAVILIALALAACGKKGDAPAPGSASASAPAPDPTAWIASCAAAIDRARAAPLWQQGRLIVDACRPCGVPWDDVLAMPVPPPARVIAVFDACHLECSTQARSDFFSAISGLEPDQSPRGAWQKLAAACPAAMSPPGPDGRFAGGAWFALHQIARRLAAARSTAALDIPVALPLVSVVGTGFELPPGDRADAITSDDGAAADREVVTITASEVFLGKAPRAHLTAQGLTLEPGRDWPGRRIDPEELASGPTARVIVAPAAMPAARVLEVVRADPRDHARYALAVTPSGPPPLFGGELVVRAMGIGTWTPKRRFLVMRATGDRAGVVDRDGKVVVAAALGAGGAAALAPKIGDLVLVDPTDATVADLAALGLAYHGLVTRAAPIAWPATLGTVDDVARAAAEPTSP